MLKEIYKHPADRIAVIDNEGQRLRYGDICAFADKLEHVFTPRSLLFLLAENTCGGIAWAISSILSGNVPLLLSAHQEDGLVEDLISIYQPPFICLPTEKAGTYADYKPVCEYYGYTLLATGYPQVPINNELSHLLPTSGSTGSPKLVRHKYDNIEAAALNISTFFDIKPEDRALMVLPIFYTMGLSMLFSHFKVGATILATNKSMTDPAFWKFIKEERATSFTGVPYSFNILNLMRIWRMDLPDLHLLTQGGGKMPHDLNLKFAEWCRDTGREWVATYGQSEGTARMAYLPSKWAIEKIGSIGIAVPNGELWLIDDNGNRIETPHTEGEMCYRGKNVTMGYARSKEDLLLGDERHGWMRTGDLAYFDEDGCYYITGRMGRFLKLFGKRIGLDDCEQIVKKAYPSMECACVGSDEKLTVYVTKADAIQDVKAILVDKIGIPATVIDVRYIDTLPKSEAGKILYSKLK